MKEETVPRDVVYRNENFIIAKYDYNLQFFPYYNARLNLMKDSLERSTHHHWPDTPIHDLADLADKKDDDEEEESEQGSQGSSTIDEEILQGKEVVVIGTLFKKMPSQPTILKELDDEKKMVSPIEVDQLKFVTKDDAMFLQAGDQSIELKGDIKIGELCTGICVAVKGHINPHGSGFLVDGICFPMLKHVERPLQTKDYYVAITSGLGFSKFLSKNKLLARSLNVLFDILTGNQQEKQIVNLIVAGNSLSKTARDEEKSSDTDKTPAWNKKVQSYTVEAVKLLDKFLANVGQFMNIDVMPGALDPCNYLWPQQPLHPCLMPNAFRLDSVRSVSNPHRATYFGVDMLGTSGQNIDSIRSCTSMDESIDIMRQTMEWGHLAPTSPDLLHCYPFSDKDPLVLDTYPDVLFAGSQAEFGMGSFESHAGKKTTLISVPMLEEKRMVILVNLRTLNCEMIALN